jgi:hypothetical protein
MIWKIIAQFSQSEGNKEFWRKYLELMGKWERKHLWGTQKICTNI